MKSIFSALLLLHSVNALALEEEPTPLPVDLPRASFVDDNFKAAEREELPIIESGAEKEIAFSTADIPERMSVVVRCEVKLPHYYKSQFSFYVLPRVGEFGGIEERIHFVTWGPVRTVTTELGSKVYTNHHMYGNTDNKTSVFFITQVKQSNEAIVIHMSKLPTNIEITCNF